MSPKKEGQPSTCNQPVGGNFRRIISDVQFWVAYLMLCCNPFSSHKTSIKEKKKVTAETRSNVQEAYCSMDKDKWIPQKSTGGIFSHSNMDFGFRLDFEIKGDAGKWGNWDKCTVTTWVTFEGSVPTQWRNTSSTWWQTSLTIISLSLTLCYHCLMRLAPAWVPFRTTVFS